MKYGTFLKAAFYGAAITAFCANVQARIGEAKETIEARLSAKQGGAYFYNSKEERTREAFELPYKNMFLLMPRGTVHSFIFKRDGAETATDSDTLQQHDLYGWEVHFCYYDGLSALEFYRKHGNPMTEEELEKLMTLVASQRGGNAFWKKSDFIPVYRRWKILAKDGTLKLDAKATDASGKPLPISEILPKNPQRFIYVEMPQGLRQSGGYYGSIPALIMEDEQRKANERYSNYVSSQANKRAAKTAKKNNAKAPAGKQVNTFNAYSHRRIDSETVRNDTKGEIERVIYDIEDVWFGDRPVRRITKDIRITKTIPLQPDTAFGFDYELSDGSMRARLYNNAVLFISAEFDRDMRKYMETLYQKQSLQRKTDAEESLSKF